MLRGRSSGAGMFLAFEHGYVRAFLRHDDYSGCDCGRTGRFARDDGWPQRLAAVSLGLAAVIARSGRTPNILSRTKAACEPGHTAIWQLRATLLVWNGLNGVRHENVGGNDRPALFIEYRPSSRHIQSSPRSGWTSLLWRRGL